MAKRISEVERITFYFQTADESAASVMFLVVKGIMNSRFAAAKPPRKARGPYKKVTPASDAPARLAGTETPGKSLAAGN
jgi:hypothetical protein